MTGCVSHIQRFSVHDGPGVRTTVFFMGCPLRCIWCHNPETIEYQSTPAYNPKKCINCLACTAVCHALTISETNLTCNKDVCISCFKCVENCPPKALNHPFTKTDAETLLKELLYDQTIYRRTSGGVTFSGGEPTLQNDFLLEMLELCTVKSLHTAIDTCGLCESAAFIKLCKKTDIVLFDMKHMDSLLHEKFTGKPNELILENVRLLSENNIRTAIRIPIVPSYNDDDDNLTKTAHFIKSLNNVESVTLLGYHKLGLSKSYGFGLNQEDIGIKTLTNAHMKKLCASFQKKLPGIPVNYL